MSDILIKIGVGLLLVGAIVFASYHWGKEVGINSVVNAPSNKDTVWLKGDTITIQLPAKTIYKVPDSTKVKINSLTNNVDSLKQAIENLSMPYLTEIDSTRYWLQILSYPYEKTNNIALTLKIPEITKTIYITEPTPYYKYGVVAILSGAIIYSLTK
jgi:hypothetical protein